MAWALKTTTSAFLYGGSSSSAQNHAAGSLIIVLMSGTASRTVTAIANTAGDTYTQCSGVRRVDYGAWVDIWYTANSAGNASNVITPTMSNTDSQGSLIVVSFTGHTTTSPFEAAANGNDVYDDNVVTTGSFSPAAAGNLNIAIAASFSQDGGWTAGGSYTLGTEESTTHGIAMRLEGAASGSQTASITHSAAGIMNMGLASFKPAAGASFVPYPLSSRGARGGLLVPSGGLQ